MEKILVTGSNGLLGSSLTPYHREIGYNIITHSYTTKADVVFNLSDRGVTYDVLDSLKPSIIINLVGLTSVELCEEQINLAYLTNTCTVENLVNWIQNSETSCYLIQISSDHLYDGFRLNKECDVHIGNNYAFSKYAGELSALQVSSSILRTNFVGRSKVKTRESLTDWVFNSIVNNRKVQVLKDVYFSPLSITLLVKMIALVVKRKPIGIYNLGSHEGMSKAEFDFSFAKCLNLPTHNMECIEISQASFLKAYRPRDMRMDSSKFETDLDIKLPKLSDLIKQIASEYHEFI